MCRNALMTDHLAPIALARLRPWDQQRLGKRLRDSEVLVAFTRIILAALTDAITAQYVYKVNRNTRYLSTAATLRALGRAARSALDLCAGLPRHRRGGRAAVAALEGQAAPTGTRPG
jgi:hypothetical protein